MTMTPKAACAAIKTWGERLVECGHVRTAHHKAGRKSKLSSQQVEILLQELRGWRKAGLTAPYASIERFCVDNPIAKKIKKISLPRLVSDLNRERPHAYHASGCCPSACLIPDRQASLPIHAKANNWAFAAVCTAHACPCSTAAAIYCINASITCSSYKATSHAAVGCPEAVSFVIPRNLLICSNLVLLQSVPAV